MKQVNINKQQIEALKNNTKTQFRLVVTPMSEYQASWLTMELINKVKNGKIVNGGWQMYHPNSPNPESPLGWIKSPYNIGEKLSVSEIFHQGENTYVDYKPDLFIQITDIKVERLLDISDIDVLAEGFSKIEQGINSDLSLKDIFIRYWDSIVDDKYYSKNNDWVWVYTFEKVSDLPSNQNNKKQLNMENLVSFDLEKDMDRFKAGQRLYDGTNVWGFIIETSWGVIVMENQYGEVSHFSKNNFPKHFQISKMERWVVVNSSEIHNSYEAAEKEKRELLEMHPIEEKWVIVKLKD